MFTHCLDLALRSLKRSRKLAAFVVVAVSVGVAASACAASRTAGRQAVRSNAQSVTPSAYQCTAGSKVWIQMDPCPRIYLKDPRYDGDSYTMESDLTRGSSVPLERIPVQQQQLDASELCRELDDHKIPLKHHGSSDVYERNLAKSKYCQWFPHIRLGKLVVLTPGYLPRTKNEQYVRECFDNFLFHVEQCIGASEQGLVEWEQLRPMLVTLFVGASRPVGRMLSMYASRLGYQRCAREIPELVNDTAR